MIHNSKAFHLTMEIIMILLALACLLPFVLLFICSITAENDLILYGYSFVPRTFSAEAYEYLWGVRGSILQSYLMSVVITAIGTVANVTITTLFAYPLSRPDLPGRRALSFFLFFSMLFNGGFVPTYMVYTQILHIKDTLAAMIVPYLLMNAFYVIMMRAYISQNIPSEVSEAARIDGAGELQCLWRVVLPMSKPIIGTVALMSAIAYWNDWKNGIYFIITRQDLFGIQNYLNSVMSSATFLSSHMTIGTNIKVPSVGIRMAIAVIAVLPVLAGYPFFQRFFVKGITIGSVKG